MKSLGGRKGRRRPLAAFYVLALFLVAAVAHAQAPRPEARVSEIRVEGAQRIEPETVRSYMSIRAGDPIDPAEMDKSLKSLFATGLFADVTLRQEGTVVVVRVVENPIINRVAFEGNRRIEDKDLTNEIQLRPRVVYTRSRVQRDAQRIIDIYRRSGRFAATVEPKIIQLPQNRVDLVFEIDEGPLTGIRRITFVGNQRFSDSRLREVLQTKESAWYRFLSNADVYDPDRLTFDRELLRRHYLKYGYADFRVVSAVAELAPSKDDFFITFTIEEGERYKFGKIDIMTGLRNLDPTLLRQFLTVKEGEWYDADAVETSINALTDHVGTRGYAFVEIRPRIRRDREKLTIDVTFDIQEGPRVFVERIDIEGNVRTEDRVIRREMKLVEGDAFNTARMRQSRRNLQNLGFFDKIDVRNEPGTASDRTVVKVEVREKSTGEVSFGAGVSTSAGLLGDISIRERNLLGRGQDLRVAGRLGTRLKALDLSFTEPYLFERPLAGGIDMFHAERDFQEEASFDRTETGFALRTGYNISSEWRQTLRYTLRHDRVENVPEDASTFIKEQQGGSVTSLVGQSLIYDLRDNRQDPSEGLFARLSNDLAGLGGSVEYFRTRLEGGVYFPFAKDYVLSLTGEAGYIFPFDNDKVRIQDRFFVGGDNLRGFESAGVGPRDVNVENEDALGGQLYYVASTEFSYPLGLPSEFDIRGKAFIDAGTLRKAETDLATFTDTGSIRISVGVGLAWRSPFGPIRIDLAKPIKKEEFDKTELIHFSFGTRF
jgi:outer membrane protein insertion porin family